MPKFKFVNRYGAETVPDEVVIEAKDEDEAWEKFDKKHIQSIVDAFTCDQEEE